MRLQRSLRSGLPVLGFIAGWAVAERVDLGPGGLRYLVCVLVGWQLGELAKRAWRALGGIGFVLVALTLAACGSASKAPVSQSCGRNVERHEWTSARRQAVNGDSQRLSALAQRLVGCRELIGLSSRSVVMLLGRPSGVRGTRAAGYLRADEDWIYLIRPAPGLGPDDEWLTLGFDRSGRVDASRVRSD